MNYYSPEEHDYVPMTADRARALVEETKETEISEILYQIDIEVERAAKHGSWSLDITKHLQAGSSKFVYAELERRGFKVKYHPDDTNNVQTRGTDSRYIIYW